MKTQIQTYTMHNFLAKIALLKDEQAQQEWKAKHEDRCAEWLQGEQTAIRSAVMRRRTLFAALRQNDNRAARYTGKRQVILLVKK